MLRSAIRKQPALSGCGGCYQRPGERDYIVGVVFYLSPVWMAGQPDVVHTERFTHDNKRFIGQNSSRPENQRPHRPDIRQEKNNPLLQTFIKYICALRNSGT